MGFRKTLQRSKGCKNGRSAINKLYTFLAERFLCDIVNENVSNQSISAALPAVTLPSKDVAVGGAPDDDKLEQN
jgi:hypothetical protein